MDKLDRVRKLLRKAEGAATTEEAEAYTAKATELMQRYSIDEAALGSKQESSDQLGSKRYLLTTYAKPTSMLLTAVADAFDCKAVRLVGRGGSVTIVVVYGWESDLAIVDVLFGSLQIQASRECDRAQAAWPGQVNTRSFRTSFLVGFANTVYGRLKEQRRTVVAEADTSAPGTALAVIDRSKAVDRQYQQEHPRARHTRPSQIGSTSGFYAGADAGQRADLGTGNGLGRSGRAALRS